MGFGTMLLTVKLSQTIINSTRYLLNFANVMLRIPHMVFPNVLAPYKHFASV